MLHFSVKSVCMCMLCFFTFVKLEPSSEPLIYDKYRTLDEIDEFIEYVQSAYSDIVTGFTIGTSSENRAIKGLKIGKKTDSTNSTKPGIVIDGGIHAREWVSTVAVLYLLGQLVNDKSLSDLTEGLDWYIIPMLNPDGYYFTMDPNGNRLWRKNRSINPSSECRGVDLNRNFNFAWGGEGSSDNPCDWNYRGPYPLSEPEAKSLAEFIKAHVPQIKMYLTLHSAAQAIIYPWGFTETRPTDWKELDDLARKAAQEMYKINRTSYQVGPTTQTVGVGAGGSDDWAKGVADIKYVYTMELPGLDYPLGGFHPPEAALDNISKETFQGIKVFANHILSQYGAPQLQKMNDRNNIVAAENTTTAEGDGASKDNFLANKTIEYNNATSTEEGAFAANSETPANMRLSTPVAPAPERAEAEGKEYWAGPAPYSWDELEAARRRQEPFTTSYVSPPLSYPWYSPYYVQQPYLPLV